MYEQSVHHTKSPARGPTSGVTAQGLGKRFGDLWALRDLHLDVQPGTVLGLLGHNGAGKTTAIRILTTLSAPTEGSATVAGLDVVISDVSPDRLKSSLATISGNLARQVSSGKIAEADKAAALARIATSADLEALADADLVI